MKLTVNGEPETVQASTLQSLLVELGHDGEFVATALNGEFVARELRVKAPLFDGDRVEILAPMQGG